MAVYIVHASLLLIFLGGIVDALYGWRGFLTLTPGTTSSQIELNNGAPATIPFSIRCDGTGEETYTDGTPKSWWSKLAVVDGGREVRSKEIVVNDPLVYHGRAFLPGQLRPHRQARPADSSTATPAKGKTERRRRKFRLALNQTVALDPDTTVQLAEFIPDYVVHDGQVYTRSNDSRESRGPPDRHFEESERQA